MPQLKKGGFKEALDTIKLLSLPPGLRRKYLARMGRMGIAQTKKNIRDQKTVSGAPMKARKREAPKERPVYHRDRSVTMKKGHKKMLVDMVKGKNLGVKVFDDEAKVQFFRNVGYVAYRHQHGGEEAFSLKIKAQFPQADYSRKCNDSQAVALARIGLFQNGKRVGKEWIMTHITVGHAAKILQERKAAWAIPTPARPFLGANQRQISAWGDLLMGSLNERFRAKQYGHTLV